MKCISCEYFHIRQRPLPDHLDSGLAECLRYNLVIDFSNYAHLKRLECVGDSIKTPFDKMKEEIQKYESKCQFEGTCKECNNNVFKTIYEIIDKYKAVKE